MNFCPACGTKKGPFINSFCAECFAKDNPLARLPQRIELQKCRKCGKILLGRQWVTETKESLADLIAGKAKFAELKEKELGLELKPTEKGFKATLKVTGLISGAKVSAEYFTEIVYSNVTCNVCAKISSSYYEALIQLRSSNPKKLNKAVLETEHLLKAKNKQDPLSRIIKKNTIKNGVDLLVGSDKAAKPTVKEICNKFNASLTKSMKQTGMTRDGKKKAKSTYLIRLPD